MLSWPSRLTYSGRLTHISDRDVVLGTCTFNRVLLEYSSRILVLVLVLEGAVCRLFGRIVLA